MSTEQAFLDDILAHPDEDAPRLIFADWLEDHGDEVRARFIRLQCRLARMDDTHPERGSLLAEVQDLVRSHGPGWAGALRGRVDEWQFRRGFVECVELSGALSRERLRRLVQNIPLRSLRLEIYGADLPEVLAAGSWLGGVRELYLRFLSPVGDRKLVELCRHPGLEYLASLMIECAEGDEVPDADLVELARPGALPRLQELGLRRGEDPEDINDPILRALAQARHPSRLRRLYLPGTAFRQSTARALAHSPLFAALTHLGLEDGVASEETWRDLLWPPALGRLRYLWLRNAAVVQGDDLLHLDDTRLANAIRKRFFPAKVDFDDCCGLPRWHGTRWEWL
jgi:uncharacterized protein (TIGR02996 family)